MSNPSMLVLAEPQAYYNPQGVRERLIEVLVDCPGVEGLLTYRVPGELSVQPGDVLSVPLAAQIVGAIAIRYVAAPPANLDPSRIRDIEDVITSGFFPPYYWQLLNRVAQYYCTDLITVIRMALPPGLLEKSQRRLRLKTEALPKGAEAFCSLAAQQVLRLLQSQKEGDYSAQYLQRQVKGAYRAIRELIKRGWIESYLEAPKPIRAKLEKVVTLIAQTFPADLTKSQRETLEILRHQGGEVWLSDLKNNFNITLAKVNSLQKKGCVVIEEREKLRFLQEPETPRDAAKSLTPAQANALKVISNLKGFSQVLLHGVTGSGKTEVYLQAIAPLLEQKKSVLVLVPEIGLTPQLTDRFRARFGDMVYVYHSGLSDGERYDTWRQMLTATSQVVIGTRSAIFAPLPNLSLIILDEEHDSSFKQVSPAPTYHARTVATWRAALENCPLILGSATPSLESWVNVGGEETTLTPPPLPPLAKGGTPSPTGEGRIGEDGGIGNNIYYLSLPERIQSRPLPPVKIVDMREELQAGNRSIFSRSLQDALENLLQQGKQGILFISRRGHSTFVSCRSCGYVVECPHCDVSLSYHYTHEGATELLRCHYCNHTQLHPKTCPECGSPYLKFFGSGTQKVTQELTGMFPDLRWIRFDSDTTSKKGAHRELLSQFAAYEADVLVGTQMLTKGLDLAGVTLVGVVAADGLLYHSDYRASERAFQTLTQVAGRAGRGDEPGKVIVQTYSPDHPVIQAVRYHNYAQFIGVELPQRKSLTYPPYGRLILLRVTGVDGVEVQQTAEMLADVCNDRLGNDCEILGPAPASIMRVARRYRWHILLKFPSDADDSFPNLSELRSFCPQSVSMTIDVDPLSID